ncbi:unnamed protein product [Choristocarpus tenellus]
MKTCVRNEVIDTYFLTNTTAKITSKYQRLILAPKWARLYPQRYSNSSIICFYFGQPFFSRQQTCQPMGVLTCSMAGGVDKAYPELQFMYAKEGSFLYLNCILTVVAPLSLIIPSGILLGLPTLVWQD